ncbi:MAG TPA: ester cyclase [Dehalococcoidia bacterium]|jgi:steroid delta-isomerase-like uncharacterized protein|nr:ester cyclase [Dehalococcoidia bacterium]
MTTEANKELVRRFHEEVESRGRLELIEELFAPEFRDTGHPERGTGPQSVREHVVEMRRRFPDLTVTVDHLVAEGDWVVARLTSIGTHGGAFAGIQPTGKTVSWSGVAMRRIENGRIVEQWTKYDMLALLRQLGALQFAPRPAAE